MLRQRLITGALLIAGLLGVLWLDDRASEYMETNGTQLPWWTGGTQGLVLAIVAAIAVAPVLGAELARMLRGAGIAAPTGLTVAAAVAGTVLMRALPEAVSTQAAGTLIGCTAFAVLLAAFLVHARAKTTQGVVAAIGGTLLSFIYVGVLLGVWLLIRNQVGVVVVAGAMLTVKSSDTGAYFTGMSIGKHKMIPWLSPGKTWEGFVGGVVGAALVGGLLAMWSASLPETRDHISIALGIVGGALLGVVGPCGDLAESLLKRSAGVKDSGSLLPGMGGAFDVLDSPLFAGPVVLLLLALR